MAKLTKNVQQMRYAKMPGRAGACRTGYTIPPISFTPLYISDFLYRSVLFNSSNKRLYKIISKCSDHCSLRPSQFSDKTSCCKYRVTVTANNSLCLQRYPDDIANEYLPSETVTLSSMRRIVGFT